MDNVFDRVFNQAAAAVGNLNEQNDVHLQQQRKDRSEEDSIRKMTTNMTAADAIQRILLASKDKDYFRMMQLPLPEVDALGRPEWNTTPNEVSKAYRKLSILVHPDKNPGDDARNAFEALNEAHRLLKDPSKLEGILKDHLEKAKARKEEAEAKATLEERVILNAQQAEQAKILKKQEGQDFQQEILRQIREKQEKAKRKRETQKSKSSYTRRQRDDDDDDNNEALNDDSDDEEKDAGDASKKKKEDDSDDEEDEVSVRRRRQALAKRKQQRRPGGL